MKNMNFEEPKPLNDVAEFHDTYDLPVLDEPQLIPKERAQLRINLLTEELKELKEAIANDDLVEIADALCDLQYVLSGAILEFGMGKKFRALFDEVHRSNMSKTCATPEEANETIEFYADRKSTRLNSSHVAISYAVFCLKKKIIKLSIRTWQNCTCITGTAARWRMA